MIDTIIFTLSKDTFSISDADQFTPSADWVMKKSSWASRGIRSRQNPTKKDLNAGIYKPRLALFHHINLSGKQEIVLRIEFSLPKFFFGNNFEELQYKNFIPLIDKLAENLKQMGVEVSSKSLMHANVSAIHYSKNIALTDGFSPYYFLSKIKEANINLSLDVNQTDYRNDGHSYKWHCNSYEVIFYDKIRDLEAAKKSTKRAIEKDNTIQLDIFPSLRSTKKFEVLRMEVRLNQRKKIKQLFEKIGIKAELTFKKLFKPAISKKILLHYLDELISKRPALLDYQSPINESKQDDKALLATLIINNPTLSPKLILQMFGLKKALETMSLRELNVMIGKKNKRSWYRLLAEIKKLTIPNKQGPLETLRKHLEQFKPLNLAAIKK